MIAALVLAAAIAVPARPSDYVTDNAGALGSATAQSLRTELRSYEQSTGHHVIVWIGQTTGGVPLEDWTIHAAEQWKVGRKGADDGAILFLFMRDHKVRIEVGYGLESVLPDASASMIIRDTIVPKMRAGDVEGAVQSGVDRMLLTITPSYASKIGHPVEQAESGAAPADAIAIAIIVLIFFGLIGLIVLSAMSRRFRNVWYWGGGSGWGGGGGWSGGGGGGGFSGSFGGGFGGGGASGSW
jgi:uncharacterized protein